MRNLKKQCEEFVDFQSPTVMTSYPIEKLGNLIDCFEAGVNYAPISETDIGSKWRVLKISSVTWGDFNPYESKPIEPNTSFCESIVVRKGDLLMSRANTQELVGAVAMVREVPPKVLLPDKLWRIKFHKESRLLPEYALLALRRPEARKIIEDLATGSSGSMKNISMKKAVDIPILLPPVEEQRRIAAIASKADHLRRTRRYSQQLSDTYLQSVFLEMFGDPVSNPKGWRIKKLKAISKKFSDGPFGSNLKTEHYMQRGVRVIRLKNAGIGELIDEDKAYVSEEHAETLAKHTCLPGDVIVGTMGDPNLRAFILPTEISRAINKADCVQIRADSKESVAEFLCWLLNMPQTLTLASSIIVGQTRERISMGRLAELEVPVPPLPLQQKFATIVQNFERLRTQQREAERQAEHLFQSILHRAFRGEL